MSDSIALLLKENPLLAFSPLTHVQVAALLTLGDEIRALISESITTPEIVDGATLNQAYARLWLWVLGAYEVMRTMAQAKVCLTEELAVLVNDEKRYLARLRMPLSKQEFAANKVPSGLAGLLSGVDTAAEDVSFTINGEVFSARSVIHRFESLVASIKLSDIRARHGDSY